MSREQADKLLKKWISRKLFVFLLATIFLTLKFIDATDWVLISCIYIGTETALTALDKRNNGGQT